MRQKTVFAALAILALAFPFHAIGTRAQTPEPPSIADAARRNREEKKTVSKPAKVITNDTLKPATPQTVTTPTATGTASTLNSQAPAPSTPASAASDSQSAVPDRNNPDADKRKAELTALKQQFKDKQSEVDLLARLLSLDQEAIQSKPDAARDADGKAKLQSEMTELQLKKEELEQLKSKLQGISLDEAAKPEDSQKP